MNTLQNIKYSVTAILLMAGLFACDDALPTIEELPSPDVNFNYSVTDASYQLDYYVGATVQFVSTSAASGTGTWDFGDGSAAATGTTVTHKYNKAGTYQVKLTIEGSGYKQAPVMISDIRPILSLQPIAGGICEVITTSIGFNVELPNPEGLQEEYTWDFPSGTMNEAGNQVTTFAGKDPGKIRFSNVGSQRVSLQVKLGGRTLEEGALNVQVAYNQEVPTLYYAEKAGNIKALKLASSAPAGMLIKPFDLGVKSGQKPLNILFNDTSLYVDRKSVV